MKIQELDIDVEDASDFEDEAGELLTEFCQDLEKKGMTKPLPDDSWIWGEEGISFLWNSEAITLIHKELERLVSIGAKYFPEEKVFDIRSYMFKEP